MFIPVESLDALRDAIATEPATLVYVSTKACGVCQVLKPKVNAMMEQIFPKVTLRYVDSEATPEVAAQYGIFTVPTIVVFFDGLVTTRISRHISLGELEETIARPYGMLF